MNKNKFPYRYDLVGSLLRPKKLKQAKEDFKSKKISRKELKKIENELVNEIVKQQVELGFKDVTDGEFHRSWWHLDFFEGLNGTEYYTPEKGWNFAGVETRAGGIKIIDKVTYNPTHPFFDDFKYLNQIVPEGITAKQTIPSPSVFFPVDEAHIINKAYDHVSDFYDDLISTYQTTIQHFYDLGCRYLQIDDTSWGMWASFAHEAKTNQLQPALAQQAEQAVRIINEIVDHKPDDLIITMHVCRGNYRSIWAGAGAYDPVADYLAQLHIDGYFLEYDDERSGGFEPLEVIAKNGRNQRIVLGLVTSKSPRLESIDDLKSRISDAKKYVPLENLCISTQCGFASTEEGNNLTEQDQWNKLKLVVKTAKSLWKDAE